MWIVHAMCSAALVEAGENTPEEIWIVMYMAVSFLHAHLQFFAQTGKETDELSA